MKQRNRGAIFIDYAYWKKITLFGPKAPEWIIKNVTKWTGASAERWMVYLYDAVHDREEAKDFEHRKLMPPGTASRNRSELQALEEAGFCVRRGAYAMRFDGNNGKPSMMQKGVDTHICIDAMDELWNFDAEIFCFITGDRDFVPLFKRLVMAEKFVFVLCSTISGKTEGLAVEGVTVKDLTKEEWVPGGKVR